MVAAMIKKDLMRNKVLNMITVLFLVVSAFLMAAGAIVITNTMQSIDGLFEKAQPSHFLQMHEGEFDQKQLDEFSTSVDYVKKQETVCMLNIDGSNIWYERKSGGNKLIAMSGNMMDNGFVVQNETMDYLLDMDNEIIRTNAGEIGVPISYKERYDLHLGDKVILAQNGFEKELVIRNFVRDAQMASSVRFLLNKADYDEVSQCMGETEYIIEYRLTDSKYASEFQKLYEDNKMPANGQAITYPHIILVNALSSGLLAAVMVFVSILLIIISNINLRFIIIAAMEEEIREIGTMKAIGISTKDIKALYMAKYRLLTACGCIIGYLFALFSGYAMTESTATTFGRGEFSYTSVLIPIIAVLLVYGLVMILCKRIFRKLDKVTVVESIVYGEGIQKKKKIRIKHKLWFTLSIVSMITIGIMIIPMNLASTFESPDFVSYMGSATADLRIDVPNKGQNDQNIKAIGQSLATDERIKKYSIYATGKYQIKGKEEWEKTNVEFGDYEMFSYQCIEGKMPKGEHEIALSYLSAKQLDKEIGDVVTMQMGKDQVKIQVCGIYQDITSGGYTAKMSTAHHAQNVFGYTLYANVQDRGSLADILASYTKRYTYAKILPMEEYTNQTFGSVIASLNMAKRVSFVVGILIIILITTLFVRMQSAKEHSQIAILRAVGYSVADVRRQMAVKSVIATAFGLLLGLLLIGFLGENLMGIVLEMTGIGIAKFTFAVNPITVYLLCPILLLVTVLAVTWLCTREFKKYSVMDMIR